MLQNKTMSGHLLAFFTIIVWGTTFISTKVLLKNFEPVEILFFRFLIGFAALCLAFPHRMRVTDRKQEKYFIGAGICGVTLYFLLENIALTYTLASNVGIIVSIAPFFTAILAHRFLDGERLRPSFFAGFAAAIAGIVLISLNGGGGLSFNPAGDILAVLAAVVWAFYSILTRKIGAFGYHTIQSTRRIFFYGLLFMVPAFFVFDFRLGLERFAQPENLMNILYLGLMASALCFATWNWAVKILGAVKTSVYIYMVPVVTVITSAIVLKEEITWQILLGMVLTMAGLFVSEGRFKRRTAKPEG